MGENLILHYDISGDDFTRAGEASSDVKNKLKVMGVDNNVIRKVAIAMYEGEINMVIHANGGTINSVKLDEDACIGCINCIKYCPTQAIRVHNGKAKITPEFCVDCGRCLRYCPHHA